MSRFLSVLLALVLVAGVITPAYALSAKEFKDFDSAAWWANDILWCIEQGIMQGNSYKQLEPNRYITRAEYVTMLNRLLGAQTLGDVSQYEDVSPNDWFYQDIAKAVKLGTLKGISSTEISPNSPLTREQAMTILARTFVALPGSSDVVEAFDDAEDVSYWAYSSVAQVIKSAIVNGRPENNIAPQENITRAEVAAILHRSLSHIEAKTLRQVCSGNALMHGVNSIGATVGGVLLLAPDVGGARVDVKDSYITSLVCWGGGDVYIYPGTRIKQIVVCRVDGPCVIHWLGTGTVPDFYYTETADPGCGAVDGAGNTIPMLPDTEIHKVEMPTRRPRPSRPSATKEPAKVIFHYGTDQPDVVVTADENGYIALPQQPTLEGYVFGKWCTDKELTTTLNTYNPFPDGSRTDAYVKWYTEPEAEVVEKMGAAVATGKVRVSVDTDFTMAYGSRVLAGTITNSSDSQTDVTYDIWTSDYQTRVALIADVTPNTIITRIETDVEFEPGDHILHVVCLPRSGSRAFELEVELHVNQLEG